MDKDTNKILTNSMLIFTKNIKIHEITKGMPIILPLSFL